MSLGSDSENNEGALVTGALQDTYRPRPARLDSLTGARFVAALGVFLYHASLAFPAEGAFGRTLALIGSNGAVGVDFFFALSGFVLTWSWQSGDSVRSFYRRRFARIAPAYWVALVYGLVWVIVLYGHPLRTVLNTVPALFGLQAWFPDPAVHYAANNPAWSVSAEVFFYAVFPLIVTWSSSPAGRRALAASAILLGLVVPYLLRATSSGESASWLVNTLPAARVGEFMCGMALAVLMRQGRRVRVSPWASFVAFLAGYALVPLAPGWVPHQALMLVLVLLVIAALAQADLDGRPGLLAGRVAVRLGSWSYCFYLVHLMTTQIMLFACARIVPGSAVGPVWILAAFTASLLLAAMLHGFVERPLERRLRPRRIRKDEELVQEAMRATGVELSARREVTVPVSHPAGPRS